MTTVDLTGKLTSSCLQLITQIKYAYPTSGVGRDSSVGIATRYGPDDSGIESRGGGEIFRTPSRPDLWPTQPPVQWVPGLSRG